MDAISVFISIQYGMNLAKGSVRAGSTASTCLCSEHHVEILIIVKSSILYVIFKWE